jgi:hypothetical protein
LIIQQAPKLKRGEDKKGNYMKKLETLKAISNAQDSETAAAIYIVQTLKNKLAKFKQDDREMISDYYNDAAKAIDLELRDIMLIMSRSGIVLVDYLKTTVEARKLAGLI